MYLKGMEIQGFKSFPDKVYLPFSQKVIAIVGPNGSGKSNISDALCWVMGEQRSKTLRGNKMEDVIFGGTAQRGPCGFAQVTLILGNEDRSLKSDTDEVAITRRFYRSGESEYFINKREVRLKDINELLMDTGLGRDGYSLIGQGRVDAILAAKSTDRREIFEEAAGISKYRYKKEETERKLEKTTENLVRVGDKIAELELQVEPLRKQAEAAKKFLILRDELRGLEISLWLDALDRLTEKNEALTLEYLECQKLLNTEKDALEQIYLESESCSQGIRDADACADALRQEIDRNDGEASSLESSAAALTAEQQNNLGGLHRLKEEQTRQSERVAELQNKLSERRSGLNALNAELAAIQEKKTSLFRSSSAAADAADTAAASLERLLESAAAEESAAAAAEARQDTIRSALESLQDRLGDADAEQERQATRLAEEEAELASAAERLRKKKEETDNTRNACKGFELRVTSKRQRLEAVTEELRKNRLDVGAVSARVSLLADMEKEYEGFSKAVRTVMRERERGNLKHIHGTVAELIHTEDRYTAAIETALGAGLQKIVVDREEDGKAAIDLLKRLDAGRATFHPLSVIRGRTLQEPGLEGMNGFIGIASQLVQYDKMYENIILYELGRTVVASDMNAAITISRKFNGRLSIVTLDGQQINAGGSMTGGSAARNVGILSRGNELERLKEKQKNLEQVGQKLRNEQNTAEKELANASYAAEEAAADLRKMEDSCIKLEGEWRQRSVLTEAMRENAAGAQRSKTETKTEEHRLLAAAGEAGESAQQHRAEADRLRREASEGAANQKGLTQKLRELTEEANRLQSREAALKSEITVSGNSIREWIQLLESYEHDRTERENLQNTLLEKNRQLQQEIDGYQVRAAAFRAEAEKNRPQLQVTLSKRQDLETKRSRADKNAQDANRRINELERQFAQVGQRKSAADAEEKSLLDKLWDSYELSRSAAQRQRVPLDNTGKAQKRAGQIRREIASMGNPNIGAIEEYERVNERYTFLTGQRDDIEKAKNELLGVVKELTAEMEKIFRTEFDAVAGSFTQTFTELFGGGRGEIILEDPNDILNCGIEIRVQPPGKALRSLTLLSGGERAFVAIALYFAMLKVRPAPFCVLDEIESALDENNVSRFARYARSMSDNTQFLIITHRRGSMEEADVLFGVTMQKGVSRVLSVELSEALKVDKT